MLSLLRLGLTALMLYGLHAVRQNAELHPDRGDLANAGWVAFTVISAFFAALAWAPLMADRISAPLTGMLTEGSPLERDNALLKLIRHLDARRWRRLTRWLCFLEGVRRPWQPTQFVVGLRNARPGSWLERVYAREVFRFGNAQHCAEAWRILRAHHLDPGVHPSPEVNLLLMSLDRETRPESPPLSVPPAPGPPPPSRNPRIRLFEGAPAPPPAVPPAAEPAPSAPGPAPASAAPGP